MDLVSMVLDFKETHTMGNQGQGHNQGDEAPAEQHKKLSTGRHIGFTHADQKLFWFVRLATKSSDGYRGR